MLAARLQLSEDTRRFYVGMGGVVALAWVTLWAWNSSAHADLLSHNSIGHSHVAPAVHFGLFLAGWTLMVVAMMLPGVLPQIREFMKSIGDTRASSGLSALLVGGYLGVWALFGLLAYVGDSILHDLVPHGGEASIASKSELITPAVVLLAGLYQFSARKRWCTMRGQSPVAAAERGADLLGQGITIGVNCVGSCWALMLLMFALGHGHIGWMLLLGVIMAGERLTPRRWAGWLTRFVGLALICWGAWSLVVA